VEAAKIRLEVTEFQQNIAVKQMFFDSANFLLKEGISNFFHS